MPLPPLSFPQVPAWDTHLSSIYILSSFWTPLYLSISGTSTSLSTLKLSQFAKTTASEKSTATSRCAWVGPPGKAVSRAAALHTQTHLLPTRCGTRAAGAPFGPPGNASRMWQIAHFQAHQPHPLGRQPVASSRRDGECGASPLPLAPTNLAQLSFPPLSLTTPSSLPHRLSLILTLTPSNPPPPSPSPPTLSTQRPA